MPKKLAVPEKTEDPAASKIASVARKSTKVGKLPKKEKHRLPRREKKAQQKAAAKLG